MNAVVVVTFDHSLSSDQLNGLAMEFAEQAKPSISGLIWKIFLKNNRKRSAGIYLFNSMQAAESYAASPYIDEMRNAPAIQNVSVEVFHVMEAPSFEAGAPLGESGA